MSALSPGGFVLKHVTTQIPVFDEIKNNSEPQISYIGKNQNSVSTAAESKDTMGAIDTSNVHTYAKAFKMLMTEEKLRRLVNPTMVPVNKSILDFVNQCFNSEQTPLYAFSGQVNLKTQTFTLLVKQFVDDVVSNNEPKSADFFQKATAVVQQGIEKMITDKFPKLVPKRKTIIECYGTLQRIVESPLHNERAESISKKNQK